MLNFILNFTLQDLKTVIFLIILIFLIFPKQLKNPRLYILRMVGSIAAIPTLIINKLIFKFFYNVFDISIDNIGASRNLSKKIPNARVLFYILLTPLIINSLLCIVLTFPFSAALILGVNSTWYKTDNISEDIMIVLGYLIGFYAIPDNNVIEDLYEYCNSRAGRIFLMIIHFISKPEDNGIFISKIIFVVFISFAPPYIIFECLFKFLRLFVN